MDTKAKLDELDRKVKKQTRLRGGVNVKITDDTIVVARGTLDETGMPGENGFEINASFVDLSVQAANTRTAPKKRGGVPWFSEQTRLRIEGEEMMRNWILLNSKGMPVSVDVKRGMSSSVEEVNSILSLFETVLFKS